MKVTLVAAVTLDGKIAAVEDQNSLDWTSKEDKRFFVRKTKEAGVLVMGRPTFETIGKPLPERLNVVMTRDASSFQNQPGVLEYSSASPKDVIDDLAGRGFEEVIIAGGAQIYSLFVDAGLVTDYFLTVEPILFGQGVPLVQGIPVTRLKLVSSEKLGEHAMLLHYQPYEPGN